MTTLSSMQSTSTHHGAPNLSAQSWQDPQKLQVILKKTRLDRKRMYQVLRQLDPDKTNMTTLSIFLQTATDNDITFDEQTMDYLVRHRCDFLGNVKYLTLIKDLTVKTHIEQQTGILKAKWFIKR
jgi:hypothetical protein